MGGYADFLVLLPFVNFIELKKYYVKYNRIPIIQEEKIDYD
jgi:hypothetical protein